MKVSTEQLQQQTKETDENKEFRDQFKEIIGNSSVLLETLKSIAKTANSDCSVLIFGESGTGKELVAKAIHRLSKRAHHKFTAINCSAIPQQLLEAELFGYERGAFTGAEKKRIGHLGDADMGSLFLDEIGDMPLSIQAKILRVIQEKKYIPLGSSASKQANIRFIAATNKNLEDAINTQTFRLDLYYRLNVFPINIAPLRKRTEDIEPLVRNFLEHLCSKNHLNNSCTLSKASMDILKEYKWPGNVRQLQNIIERLYLTKGGGNIEPNDFPKDLFEIQKEKSSENSIVKSLKLPYEGLELNKIIQQIENQYILQALKRTGNNKNKASKLLGMNRTTLVEKLKKRGLNLESES